MKNSRDNTNEALTTGKVAEYCNVTVRAVLKWVDEGKLTAYRTPGNHCRVQVEDFLEFLKKYEMPVPPELNRENRKRRILIADDDANVVDLLGRMFALEKIYETASAGDGFAAGQKFCSFQPDCLILDIMMPGVDGYEVCKYVRTVLENKEVKIIAMSGMDSAETKAKVLAMGADVFMAKPIDQALLLKTVRRLLKIKDEGEQALNRR